MYPSLYAVGSAFLFLLLPSLANEKQHQSDLTVKQEFNKIIAIIRDKKYRYLNIYYMFPGLCVGFYVAFLYKLIALSVKQNPS